MIAVPSAVLYLVGLGLLASAPLGLPFSSNSSEPRSSDTGFGTAARSASVLLASWLTIGILANYAMVLVLGSLGCVMVLGIPLSVGGFALLLAKLVAARRRIGPGSESQTHRAPASRLPRWAGLLIFWVSLLVIAALLATPILGNPLSAWDARSIWFFQAKMIYYAGALSPATGFSDVPWCHADYPKLLSSIAGQLAFASGFWNEYLPKGAELLLLLPVALGYASFYRPDLSFVFLISLSLLAVRGEFWDGYADGALALLAGLAALTLGRWLIDRDRRDLSLGILSLGACSCLKNEGAPLALIILACFGVASWARGLRPIGGRASMAYLAVAASFGFAAWEAKKRAWGLTGDFVASADLVQRISSRLASDGLQRIFQSFFRDGELHAAIAPWAVALGLAVAARAPIPVATWIAAASATLYTCVLALTYLMTPFDLDWHLATSASRTLIAPAVLWYAASYWILSSIERSARTGSRR